MAGLTELERTQEVQQRLLVTPRQRIVVLDHLVGFRPAAGVLRDRYFQVVGASVVQEEDALTDAPQRSRAELAATSTTLRDAIREPVSHVMHGKIAVRLV